MPLFLTYCGHSLAGCWPPVRQGLLLAHLWLAVHHDPEVFFCKAAGLCICLCWASQGFPERFSSLLRSLWMTVIPPLYQSLSPVCNHPLTLWKCILFYNPDCYENLNSIVPLSTNLWAYQPSHFFTHLFSLKLSSLATRMFWEIISDHADQGKHPEF